MTKQAVKTTIQATKIAIKTTIAIIKAIITATKALVSAIIAGGWVAVVVIVVICLIAMICSSVFEIFFANEKKDKNKAVILEIYKRKKYYAEIVNGSGITIEKRIITKRDIINIIYKVEVIKPNEDGNFVAIANEFNSKNMREYNNYNMDDWRAEERYLVAYNSLKEHNENLSFELVKDILSGKYGFMCQYDRKTGADTVWSVIYDLKNKKIYRAEGNPHMENFKEDTRMKFVI